VNARARWRYRRVLYSGTLSGLGILLVAFCYLRIAAWAHNYYAVTRYVLVAHDIDQEVATKVSTWLDQLLHEGALAHPEYSALTHTLLDTAPLVGAVAWSRYNPTCLTCTITGVKPVFLVNDDLVAATNGRLYSTAVLDPGAAELPAVVVSKEWTEPEHFLTVFKFFTQLPGATVSMYNGVYHNPTMIVMTPKNDLDLPYRCVCIVDERSVTLLPDAVTLMGMCQHREGHISLIDFRFSGRVIHKCITDKEYKHLLRA